MGAIDLNGIPPGVTVRQAIETRHHKPACAGCHAMMDPMGFLLEDRDSLAQHRTTWRGLPIDTHALVPGKTSYSGEYANFDAFLPVMARSPEFAACASASLRAYTSGLERKKPTSCSPAPAPAQASVISVLADFYASPGFRSRR